MTNQPTTHAAQPVAALNIRSWADARVFLQTAAPVIMTALAGYGIVENQQAALWTALLVSIAAPALATINTAGGFRKWFYPVLGAANAVAIAYGIADPDALQMWLPVITLVLGGAGSGIANANTNTTEATERRPRHAHTAKAG